MITIVVQLDTVEEALAKLCWLVVLVMIPCASAVGEESTGGQEKVATEPQTAEPPPARELSDDERVAHVQERQDEYLDAYRESHPHSLFIAIHPVPFFTHAWVHLKP